MTKVDQLTSAGLEANQKINCWIPRFCPPARCSSPSCCLGWKYPLGVSEGEAGPAGSWHGLPDTTGGLSARSAHSVRLAEGATHSILLTPPTAISSNSARHAHAQEEVGVSWNGLTFACCFINVFFKRDEKNNMFFHKLRLDLSPLYTTYRM